jgi:hypothetical protein
VALGAAAAIFLLGATLFCLTAWAFGEGVGWAQGADWFTGVSSAALLGSMVAAMLLGHTYLIAPGMSIDPLRAMVWWIAGAVGARSIATCISLARLPSLPPLSSALDWMLGGRILIGLVGPAIIAWMVWQTARIRSTQSATGILYAGVVLAFLGELLGQLLGM